MSRRRTCSPTTGPPASSSTATAVRGVSAAALRGALDLIAQAGGCVVEHYPRDTQGKKISASHLYNGTRNLYGNAGFEYVRSKGQFNCVMRTTVRSA